MDSTSSIKDTIWQTGYLEDTHFIQRNKHWFSVKVWNIYQPNGPRKQEEVAILISDKADFKFTLIK
jgi:hypothetical protein